MGPDALAVCQALQGLPVGFLLLRYSVLFTVEYLSLLYLFKVKHSPQMNFNLWYFLYINYLLVFIIPNNSNRLR